MSRKIEIVKAVRSSIPVNVGLWGPSGCGKTYSALRLASGIKRVYPGPIVLVDTENGRGKHYADLFDYEYVSFDPPFNPLDYLDVLQQVEIYKPSVIIVDSFSHEHSGIGGYLETQEKKAEELAGKWRTTRDKAAMPAWAFASGQRKKLIRYITRMNTNLISCFRAKDKSAPAKNDKGKMTIEHLGYMPEAGKEYVFEMTLSCLLPPGSKGHAVFQTGNKGEDLMTKLPEQFRKTFEGKNIQLTEEIGEKLALWAKGDEKPRPEVKKVDRQVSQPVNSPAPSEFDFSSRPEDKLPTLRDSFEEWYNACPDQSVADKCRETCEKNGWTDDVINWAISQMRNCANG